MDELLLTIAIPTYNRYAYLKENLDVLLPQCAKYEDIIKVVVSDNASTDDTQKLLTGYIKVYPKLIHYNRNEKNIGLQGNFSKAIELSHSKYIYLMGDDDILSPNFLEIIIPYLKSDEEFGIVHWGRLVGDACCSNNKIQDPYFDVLVGKYEVGDFIKRTLSSTNFLSSCLFNKKCWELGEKCEDKEMPGYGYYARFLNGAVELNKQCVYYYYPLVLMRNPVRTWAKDAPIYFFCEMYDIFRHLELKIPGVYKLWQERANNKVFYDKILAIRMMHIAPKYYKPYSIKIEQALSRKEKFLYRLVMVKPIESFDIIYRPILSIINKLFY
jgi:glycosyltransferase involved in cell wall biosynthesis